VWLYLFKKVLVDIVFHGYILGVAHRPDKGDEFVVDGFIRINLAYILGKCKKKYLISLVKAKHST